MRASCSILISRAPLSYKNIAAGAMEFPLFKLKNWMRNAFALTGSFFCPCTGFSFGPALAAGGKKGGKTQSKTKTRTHKSLQCNEL